ncbi:glycosyltransferase [Herbiconiux daphne]|uniref:4,4'-diaponeurosporenoate glycosyltransferase n=1 Tax=Herbiconiux daphne TaxID=2970914 RepID=A0ABT2GWC1_9MICO|nr:glycosyltransferase [Herbiconiux daphne]MCS5732259.1 glycosyltransferase [Herbiconiux daphne]
MIEALDVVIPARNEELLLRGSLESVLASREAFFRGLAATSQSTAVLSRVVVVLDACTDRSAAIARSFGDRIAVLEVDLANVGRARATGVAHLIGLTPGVEPTRHWVCNTDADTDVPTSWLREHFDAAQSGALAAVGRVMPRRADLGEHVVDRWSAVHAGETRHVFGANLGVRADAYTRVGGFSARSVGEDVALVRSIDELELDAALGDEPGVHTLEPPARVVELLGSVVQTSGRFDGRTPGGFAGYLRKFVE